MFLAVLFVCDTDLTGCEITLHSLFVCLFVCLYACLFDCLFAFCLFVLIGGCELCLVGAVCGK